jgi:hypothetical protein
MLNFFTNFSKGKFFSLIFFQLLIDKQCDFFGFCRKILKIRQKKISQGLATVLNSDCILHQSCARYENVNYRKQQQAGDQTAFLFKSESAARRMIEAPEEPANFSFFD